jgi:hypothetical protein
MEAQARGTELSFAEVDFIAERDSFPKLKQFVMEPLKMRPAMK